MSGAWTTNTLNLNNKFNSSFPMDSMYKHKLLVCTWLVHNFLKLRCPMYVKSLIGGTCVFPIFRSEQIWNVQIVDNIDRKRLDMSEVRKCGDSF